MVGVDTQIQDKYLLFNLVNYIQSTIDYCSDSMGC